MKKLQTVFLSIMLFMALLIFAIQTGASTYQFKQVLEEKVQETMLLQAKDVAGRIGLQLDILGKTTNQLATNMEALPQYNAEFVLEMIKNAISNEPFLFGSGFWLEPYVYDKQTIYYGPYVYKTAAGAFQETWEYSNEKYNYHAQDWYLRGLRSKAAVTWSEPYFDEISGIKMITVASPIHKNGSVVGVMTTDIHIDSFLNEISKIQVGNRGYAFLTSGEGVYLNHPEVSKNLSLKITEDPDEDLRLLGRQIYAIAGTGLQRLHINRQEVFAVYTPVGTTGMKLILIMPVADAFSPVTNIIHKNLLLFITAILVFSFFLIAFFRHKISRPIDRLMGAAKQIGKGNFNTPIPVVSKDELGQLALSMNSMQKKIAEFINRLQLAHTQLADAYEVTIRAFYEALEHRESSTAEHSLELNLIAMEIGKRMELSEDQLRHLNWGTLLHDIGKLAVPDHILLKPGKLSPEEFELIKRHPAIGYQILSGADYLKVTAEIALYHQEKYDGSGYPYGLQGEEIPLLARICTIADAFQAMIADRPYRKGRSLEEAVEEVKRCSGTHFDPAIVAVFLTLDLPEVLKASKRSLP